MSQNRLSVSEALRKLESGEQISGYTIDFERIKIESLDVMKLSKGGVIVPEESIYYADDEIVLEDEEQRDWERIDYDTLEENKEVKTEVKIVLKKDIQNWVETKDIKLDKLLEQLLEGFYQSQKIVKED